AKTPSTPGIPDSCTTSAIFENDDCTSFTFVPNLLSRCAASSNACASWSRLINLPNFKRSPIASEWPPPPTVASMYVPSGFTSSHSSTSSNKTGVCGTSPLTQRLSGPLDTPLVPRKSRAVHCSYLDVSLPGPTFRLSNKRLLCTQQLKIVVRKRLIL